MDTKDLIRQFNQSKAGRVINGSEAFRNRMGRILHGLSYQHPWLATAGSVATIALGSAFGTAGLILTSPAAFSGAYAAVTPRSFEKAACDFLMNQGVRKAAAFANFLEKRGIDPSTREAVVGEYLEQQAPKFGYYKEYQKEFPKAAQQIIDAGMKGDLPLRHSQDLYKNEIIQETLTRSRKKGGILRGMLQTFSPETRRIQEKAEKLAKTRWEDRQKWLAQPPESRSTWRAFYKEEEFQRFSAPKVTSISSSQTQLPKFDLLNAQFEQQKTPDSSRFVRNLKEKEAPVIDRIIHPDAHSPDRDRVDQIGDYQRITHIRDNARVAITTQQELFRVTPQKDHPKKPETLRERKLKQTTYYDPVSQAKIQQTLTKEESATDLRTHSKKEIITETTTLMDGVTHSRTKNTETGETIFREQTMNSHKEWQFDKDKRLTSYIDNDFGTENIPAQYRQTDFTYTHDGVLKSSTENVSIVTPDGNETKNVIHRDASGNTISNASNDDAVKHELKVASGFTLQTATVNRPNKILRTVQKKESNQTGLAARLSQTIPSAPKLPTGQQTPSARSQSSSTEKKLTVAQIANKSGVFSDR